MLNQTKRNVLGLHEGRSVTRAKLRGRKGRAKGGERSRDTVSVKYGGQKRDAPLSSFPSKMGKARGEKGLAEGGYSHREKTSGHTEKEENDGARDGESFGVSRHVVKLLAG